MTATNGTIMFILQRPYLTRDTLEAQIYYPLSANELYEYNNNYISSNQLPMQAETVAYSDFYNKFIQLLNEVGLEYLLQQFPDPTEIRNWSQVLSVGEQQRLSIARVLYHLPSIVIMDESTSAIDEPNEEKVFIAIKKRGIGLLSVAHRSTVKKFHDSMLLMDRSGKWEITPIHHDDDV